MAPPFANVFRYPLVRGISDIGQSLRELLLELDLHRACDLDSLRLRRSRPMHGFREISYRVPAERHVLHQPQDPNPVLGRNVGTSFEIFSIRGPIVSCLNSRSDGRVTINPPARSCARRPIS